MNNHFNHLVKNIDDRSPASDSGGGRRRSPASDSGGGRRRSPASDSGGGR